MFVLIKLTGWLIILYYNVNVTELTNCDTFINDWMGELNDSDHHTILRTVKLYKDEFKCEDYLDLIQKPKYRTASSTFRTSSHTLAKESGHTNLIAPLEKRICRICNDLEDEIHFLVD